ncbi:putative bifunctional diguanylate cyclase/phosphodiesterase [Tropicibacter sp. S64]|uniref:putative bifunctional diguanylate cyclase/phosphodiesterase n=1 Tax=Tropicibacter sp. S64 TaxID=3415122 RepID=UPI003C7A1EC8
MPEPMHVTMQSAERELRATLFSLASAIKSMTGADGVALGIDGDVNDGRPLRIGSCNDSAVRARVFGLLEESLRENAPVRSFNGSKLSEMRQQFVEDDDLLFAMSDSVPDMPVIAGGRGAPFMFHMMVLFSDRICLSEKEEHACDMGCDLFRSLISQWKERCLAEVDRETTFQELLRYRRRAELDGLTLVENAASFRAICEHRIANCSGELALVLIDLDHFKSINDIYGHQFGDTYLKAIGRSLGGLRALDAIVGRIGGDEFAVLMEASKITDSYLQVILHQINAKVQRDLTKLKKPGLGRMSMGVSVYERHGETFDELFQRADAALYATKAAGRNGVVIFDEQLHGQYDRRSLGLRFERALERGEIIPYFQPIINLQTGLCHGVEALVRWLDPELGLLTPASFSGIMSDHSQAEKLTRTMAQQALAILSKARGVGRMSKAVLTLNVTHFDLMRPEFVFDIQEWLTCSGVDWESLKIEVTEQTMLGDIEGQVFRTLAEIRTRGARVALDDFGTGYGGLEHLKAWPVDVIKVDRNFISAMENSVRGRAVVSGLCTIAHDLGLGVIAEGIETREVRDMLMEMHCGFGQGYLYSKPVAADEICEVWDRINAEAQPDVYACTATARTTKEEEAIIATRKSAAASRR